MGKISDSLIKEIKELGDGSVEDQKQACDLMEQKIFVRKHCTDNSVIPKLLPVIVKLITSEDQSLKELAASFVEIITFTSDSLRTDKENTQLVIDHHATENLVKCLCFSHNNEAVIAQCLRCLANIYKDFPAEIMKHNALPSVIECLKSKNDEILCWAVEILENVSKNCEESILVIFEAGGIVALKNIMESSNNPKLFLKALNVLSCIICHNAESCQYVLDIGILNLIETTFKHLFDDIKRRPRRSCLNVSDNSETQENIKLFAIKFILNATYYNEKQVDMVLEKTFIPLILKQIGGTTSDIIKKESVMVIGNIIENKASFIQNLLNDGIISLLYKNLGSQNSEFLEIVLATLFDIIKYSGYDETVRQKIKECGNPEMLQNLLQREDLKGFPKDIHNFVDGNVKVELCANESDEHNEQGSVPENEIVREFDHSHVGTQEIATAAQDFVAGNVKDEPGIIVKLESSEFSEQVVVRSDAARNQNFNEYGEFSDTDFNDINLEAQNNVTVETGTINEQNRLSADIIGTQENKRKSDASEQAEPLSKRSRNGQSSNENVSRHSSPELHQLLCTLMNPPLESIRNSENAITPSDANVFSSLPEATTSHTTNRDQNDAFSSIKYFIPSEADIVKYCETLNLDFDRKTFLEFFSNFDFATITSDSKPKSFYPTNDKSGFGCFSLYFTGKESYADKIRNELCLKYIHLLDSSGSSSNEKLKQIFYSNSMTSEHLEIIVRWLKCRIMVYSDENGWEKYGDWEAEDKFVPIFVLKKIQSGNDSGFEIVLSFDLN